MKLIPTSGYDDFLTNDQKESLIRDYQQMLLSYPEKDEFRYGFNWALGALGYRLINKN